MDTNRDYRHATGDGPAPARPNKRIAARVVAGTMVLMSGAVLNILWMGLNVDGQYWLQLRTVDDFLSTLPVVSTLDTTGSPTIVTFDSKSGDGGKDINSILFHKNVPASDSGVASTSNDISYSNNSVTIPRPALPSSTNQSNVRHARNDTVAPNGTNTFDTSSSTTSNFSVDRHDVDDAGDHPGPSPNSLTKKSIPRIEGPSSQQTNDYISLHDLTRNPPNGSIDCPSVYMVPIYDRIVEEPPTTQYGNRPQNITMPGRKIPRTIHVSFNQRCIPQDMAMTIEKWHKALPDHSIYFHDDDAVDRLLNLEWDEFPELHRLLACVQFKGAMKIDVWRVLVLYKYGGLYTDIDVWPRPKFTTKTIHFNDTFFSLTDTIGRPTQWLFAMEPGHPIGSLAVREIMKRLKRMKNIARPRVVKTTGPEALNRAYRDFISPGNSTIDERANVRKIRRSRTKDYAAGMLGGTYNDMVEFQGVNMTLRSKTELISGIKHWTKKVRNNNLPNRGSCLDYLALLDSQNPNWTLPLITS